MEAYAKSLRSDGSYSAKLVEDAMKPFPEPFAGKRVLRYFNELHSMRSWGEAGPSPLTPSIIKDWSSLCGVFIRPHEARIIFDLDARYREIMAQDMEKYEPKNDQEAEALGWINAAKTQFKLSGLDT